MISYKQIKNFNLAKYTKKRMMAFLVSFALGILAIVIGGPLLQAPSSVLLQDSSSRTLDFDQSKMYTVVNVVDGDTIKIQNSSEIETVRLIGVDTPETVHPSKPVECYGKEASSFVENLLKDTQVYIELDSSQGERDRYGRLLAYIFLPDKVLVNQLIISEGYGFEYTYNTPYKYQQDFKHAEQRATNLQKGLWGEDCR
jgi:endonuclease YncB( thermonuclease family)